MRAAKYCLFTRVDNTNAGPYVAGANVSITANAASAGQVFDKWTSSGGGSFTNANSATTMFTMPANAVTVTATYEQIPDAGLTDAQKVAADKAALTFNGIKRNNADESNITGNLNLPSGGSNGSVITWSSNDTSTIANGGVVTRPDYGTPDKNVTLTATITNGSASDITSFSMVVKAKEQKQTTVETKPGAPQADVAGLDNLFTQADEDILTNNSVASIEIKLVVEKLTAATVPTDEVNAINENLGGKTLGLYLDATLLKKTPRNTGDSLSSLNVPLELENVGVGVNMKINTPDLVTRDMSGEKNDRLNLLLIGCIAAAVLLAAMILWAIIPHKDDQLVSVEDNRKRY